MDEINKPNTHYSAFESKILSQTTAPTDPQDGDIYYDTDNNKMCVYNAVIGQWRCKSFTTTTSTSTSSSTTTTSTSTTSTSTSTTSTSSSTSVTTSTSISTSTTTTL